MLLNSPFRRLFGITSHFLKSIPIAGDATSKKSITNSQTKDVPTQNKNYFKYSAYMIPHPEKAHKGGEDAYTFNNKMLTVADGVGGWAMYGIDPGKYSKDFCKNAGNLFQQSMEKYIIQPKQLIIDSHKMTKQIGSTTVCLVTIEDDKPILHSAYIGDSGYIIYRKENNNIKIVYQSQEQQKSFNFPYQIGSEGDSPTASWQFDHEIKNNDIVVVGTDGLLDNIDEKQIANCIKPFWEASDQLVDLSLVAEMLAKYAFKLSHDPTYNSPFAQRAKKHYQHFMGGKEDDITVIVGQIVLKNSDNNQK